MSNFKDVGACVSRRTNQTLTNNSLTKITGMVAFWGGSYLSGDALVLPAGEIKIWCKLISAKVAEGYREMHLKWTKPSGGGVVYPIVQVFGTLNDVPPDPPTAEDDKVIYCPTAGGTLELYGKQITGADRDMLAENNGTIGFDYYNASLMMGFQQVG